MKRKKSSVGCLFWIALILFVLIVLLFNQNNIKNVIELTGFSWEQIIKPKEQDDKPEIVRKPQITPEMNDEKPEQVTTPPKKNLIPSPKPTHSPKNEIAINPQTNSPTLVTQPTPTNSLLNRRIRRAKLYFIYLEENGFIQLKDVIRPVAYENAPLTETLNALVIGLTPSELNNGLISLIPKGTRIKSVKVSDQVAYINVNDAFRYNSLGHEGYLAQAKQIVYSATEFSTVKYVQFLIEGKKVQYLSPEGVFIGGPLSRNSF